MSTFRRRLLTNQALRVAKGDLIYPGLVAAWSAEGKTNEDSDRDIFKDLTGHGHDITLNNMAYAGMSGYGGHRNYAQGSENEVKITSVENKLNDIISLGYKVTGLKKGDIITMSVDCEAYNIKFDSNSSINIQFNQYYSYSGFNQKIISNGKTHLKRVLILNNHYNSSDPVTEEDDGSPYVRFDYITFNKGGYFLVKNFTVVKGEEEVEWFKDYQYPNALVFDGVDDYGICENIPILHDFTVIAKREYFNGEGGVIQKGGNSSGNSVFILEGGNKKTTTWSYGSGANNLIYPDTISYMTPTNYNQQKIYRGYNIDITKIITLAIIRKSDYRYWNGVFYSAYLFNKSLEESEIKSFIRKYIDSEYLLPSEIPTPDCYYDFSLGSNEDKNRETIVDQSGNGNDAKAYNFAWSGMSGYGGYAQDYTRLFSVVDKTSFKITLQGGSWVGGVDKSLYNNIEYKIKASGINDLVVSLMINNGSEVLQSIRLYEGENLVTKFNDDLFAQASGVYFNCNNVPSDLQITIEQMPLYEGALVLDGTDDYIALESFDSGFKTIFMVCKPFTQARILYDQRYEQTGQTIDDFAIFNDAPNIAYNSRNTNGTYINGEYNTTIKGSDLTNKKHLIHIKSQLTKKTTTPIIGSTCDRNGYFSKMAIYKFLGFKEELTDDQIQYVIKKYNLLDGVDEIEETT